MELISVGIRRSNFGFSRVKKIKHSRATVHFFEEESIQKNKSKPGIYYFHVPNIYDIAKNAGVNLRIKHMHLCMMPAIAL